MRLNIIIPTFNRNETFKLTIQHLLPQVTSDCRLVIIDNHSPVPVEETLGDTLAAYPDIDQQVIRNKFNIGGTANILRCFEYCDSDWLWILGDDDIVAPDAIEKIFSTIEKYPASVFFGFSTAAMNSHGSRNETFLTTGLHDFANKIDDPGIINFMSCSIWHVPSVLKNIPAAYHYGYSMTYTFTLLISSLGEQGACCFSHLALIDSVTLAETGARWSFTDFTLGWNTILEYPMPAATRKKLAAKMMAWHAPENVATYFLANAAYGGNGSFLYKVAISRLKNYMPGLLVKFRFNLYRMLFLNPSLGWKMTKQLILTAKKIGVMGVDIEDIEARAKSKK